MASKFLPPSCIGGGNVGVDLDDVGFIFLCKRLRPVQQLREGLVVVQIADRAAAAVHEAPADAGDLAGHEGQRTLELPIRSADGNGVPLPHRLLLAPEIALPFGWDWTKASYSGIVFSVMNSYMSILAIHLYNKF